MNVCFVIPPLVGYWGDPFSLLPALPWGVHSLVTAVKAHGHEVTVLDCLTAAPAARHHWQHDFELQGLLPAAAAQRIASTVDVCALSLHSGGTHHFALALTKALKERPDPPRVIAGGPWATTMAPTLIAGGLDHVVCGEGELVLPALLDEPSSPPIIDAPLIEDLTTLAPPTFDKEQIAAYTRLGRAHAPLQGPYLPLSTSRGCRHRCAFCATPAISRHRWRSLPAAAVVELIDTLVTTYDVDDFHIVDDNFVEDPTRVSHICQALRRRSRPISFALPSAVRASDTTTAMVDDMAAAGLRYIAFAPESGSPAVRRRMGKSVDEEHLLGLVRHCHHRAIACQACFVVGFPGEDDSDRAATAALARQLLQAGVDDLSFFIMAPVPGSRCAAENELVSSTAPPPEGLNWSPRWRDDFPGLARWRQWRYLEWGLSMGLGGPRRLVDFLASLSSGRYRTKGAMACGWLLRRALRSSTQGRQ